MAYRAPCRCDYRSALTGSAVLTERVADSGLRQQARDFATRTHELTAFGTKDDALSRADALADEWNAVNGAIGCALRDLYPAL